MPKPTLPPWTYYAELVHVVDGDTIDLRIDMGFSTFRVERVRLVDVDTAEIFGVPRDSDSYERGRKQKNFVAKWLGRAQMRAEDTDQRPLAVETYDETGSFNRYLASVYRLDDEGVEWEARSLSEAIIDEYGEEVKYDA